MDACSARWVTANAAALAPMLARIAHRGPDGQGTFVEGPAALGHCRLAIIDLEGGAQPLYSEDKNLVVVFNGEIYNYRALTAELSLNDRLTFYTRYGDVIGRLAGYVFVLSLLYFMAYRVRRRSHLVE